MANLDKQIIYLGQNYLDGKLLRATYTDLVNTEATDYIPSEQRFIGLTVTVQKISNSSSEITKQADVWLVGGIGDSFWKIKTIQPLAKIEDLGKLPINLVSAGLEVTVINSGNFKKYRATKKVTTDGVSSWQWTEIGVGKDYDNAIASLTSGDTVLQAQIDNLQEQINNLQLESATTTTETTNKYYYYNTNGEKVEAESQEAAENATDKDPDKGIEVVEKVVTETVNNYISSGISVDGDDQE